MSQDEMLKKSVDLYDEAVQKVSNQYLTEAIQDLITLVQTDKNNIYARKKLARCYKILGDYEKALQLWEELVESNQDLQAKTEIEIFHSPPFQFWLKRLYQGIEELERKNYSAAKILFHSLLEEHDEDISVYKLLGLTYYAMGDNYSARKVWKRGLLLDRNNPDISNYLTRLNHTKDNDQFKIKTGNNYNTNELNQKGKKNKHNFWQSVKNYKLAFCGTALLLLIWGLNSDISIGSKNQEVQTAILKPAVNTQHSPDEDGQLSVIQASADGKGYHEPETVKNEKDEEVNLSEEIPKVYNVTQEWDLYGTGYYAYLHGDYPTAIQNLTEVVNINSLNYVNREALYYLAQTYYITDSLDEACQYFINFLRDFPNSNYYDESLYYLGCVYYKKNDMLNARKYFNLLNEYDYQSNYKETSMYKAVMR